MTQTLKVYASTSSSLNRNSLVYFWEKFVNEFNFEKIPGKASEQYDPLIIFSHDDFYIKSSKTTHNEMIVVPDSNPLSNFSRFFIGFKYPSYITNYGIGGLFIYFDSQNKLVNKKILSVPVASFDYRNGQIESCLYNQTLIFTQTHRDTSALILIVNLFDNSDALVANGEHYSDGKKIDWNLQRNFSRFFSVYDSLSLDLGSLKLDNDKKYLLIDLVSNTDSNPTTTPEEYFGDGYPNKCILCGLSTTVAEYRYDNTYMNMGSGFCSKCEIRYSMSEKIWKCCKQVDDGIMCCEQIKKSNCTNSAHSTEFKLVCSFKGIEFKYPFKQKIHVTVSNI
jgi:hypothetical protein